jgi:hypothetical protein
MPVVHYYLGRPARIWIAAMSGSARATAANPAAATSPASRRPATPARQRMQEESSAPAATAVSEHVRTPPRPCYDPASSTAERQPDGYDPG